MLGRRVYIGGPPNARQLHRAPKLRTEAAAVAAAANEAVTNVAATEIRRCASAPQPQMENGRSAEC